MTQSQLMPQLRPIDISQQVQGTCLLGGRTIGSRIQHQGQTPLLLGNLVHMKVAAPRDRQKCQRDQAPG